MIVTATVNHYGYIYPFFTFTVTFFRSDFSNFTVTSRLCHENVNSTVNYVLVYQKNAQNSSLNIPLWYIYFYDGLMLLTIKFVNISFNFRQNQFGSCRRKIRHLRKINITENKRDRLRYIYLLFILNTF